MYKKIYIWWTSLQLSIFQSDLEYLGVEPVHQKLLFHHIKLTSALTSKPTNSHVSCDENNNSGSAALEKPNFTPTYTKDSSPSCQSDKDDLPDSGSRISGIAGHKTSLTEPKSFLYQQQQQQALSRTFGSSLVANI